VSPVTTDFHVPKGVQAVRVERDPPIFNPVTAFRTTRTAPRTRDLLGLPTPLEMM